MKVDKMIVNSIAVVMAVLGPAIGVYTFLVEPGLSGIMSGILIATAGLISAGSIMAFPKRLLLSIVLMMVAYGLVFWWSYNAPSWLIRLLYG